MPFLNQECSICKESFRKSDDIYSTSCGHIFHETCLSYWHIESTNCAQCRQDYTTAHKLYITLDDTSNSNDLNNSNNADNSNSSEPTTNDLKLQLKNVTDKIGELSAQLQQHFISQDLIKQLDRKINHSAVSETTCILLQEQYIESENIIKELEEKVRILTTQNQNKSQQLTMKTQEIQNLKTSLEALQSQTFETDEISLLNYMDFRREQDDMRTILIHDYSLEHLTNSLKLTAIKIASKMDLTISRADLKEVSIIQCCPRSMKATLCVRFTRLDTKINFLMHKNRLQKSRTMQFIQITEYNEEIY